MKQFLVAAMILVLATSSYGAVGDLVAKPNDFGRYGGSILQMQSDETPKPAPAGCGTVHPKAQIITLSGSESPVVVAWDADKADEKSLNVLRIDADGTGKFTAEASVPIKWPAADGTGSAQIAPTTITLVRGGHKIPVSVTGFVSSSGGRMASMSLLFSTCLEGPCAFGGKAYPVRVVDTTGNFLAGDPAKVTLKDGVPVGQVRGDMVWIDGGEGGQLKSLGAIGQPVLVDGKWYVVTVSADQAKVTAAPLAGPLGKIKIDADPWQATLIGTEHVLSLAGGKEPLEIPAGKYAVVTASVVKSKAVLTMTDYRLPQGRAEMFEVPADKTAEHFIGSPLASRVEVAMTGRTAIFSPTITDVGGRTVAVLAALAEARAKLNNQFEVRDADGKTVYSAALEFS